MKTRYELIVFDCDGVLVDSEPLANKVFCRLLAEEGYLLDVDATEKEMYGQILPRRVEIAASKLNWTPPADFLKKFLETQELLSKTELRPIAGIHDLLDRINSPKCVASNGYRAEINMRLSICNLQHYFGEAIFSGMEVPQAKPAPDVYLAAAKAFGAAPASCIAVEDSIPGATAAIRAGMTVFGYAAHTSPADLRQLGVIPFDSMSELQKILEPMLAVPSQ